MHIYVCIYIYICTHALDLRFRVFRFRIWGLGTGDVGINLYCEYAGIYGDAEGFGSRYIHGATFCGRPNQRTHRNPKP